MLTISSGTLRTSLAALLTTTAGALAFANVAVVSSSIDTSPIVVTGTVADGANDADAASIYMPEPLPSLTETTARPVFLADRKPIAAKAVAEGSAPVQDLTAGSLQLLGTVRLGKGKVKALIRTADAANGKWVPVGDTIEGWLLREVSSDRAIVEASGKRVTLKLSYAGHASASTAGTQQPPGPPAQ